MATRCVFDQNTMRCVEHGGSYVGGPECLNKRTGDRLEAKIAELQAKRDWMRGH